jgi:alpha-galactosidase
MDRGRRPRIVVIGAASSSFSGLLADLVGAKELDGAELALVDLDAEGLEIMSRLGQRMADQWGKKTTVAGTLDRREALAGADFVLTTIAVGGVKTWRQDEEIPAKHDYYGHSVDTVGPGGLFRGLRLIPPMIDICRDIEDRCPHAWVINYSNPMAGICRAVRKATSVKIVGLCTAGFLPRQIARYLDIEPERVEVISAGVNHWVWVLRILVDGADFTMQFNEKMRKEQGDGYPRSSVELMEIFGCWPLPGPNHVAEFFPYFYGPDNDGRSDARYPYRKGHDFDERLEMETRQRKKLRAQSEGKEPLGHEPEESAGEAVRMLLSMWCNRRTLHYANVQNDGLVTNLPDHAIVEIPAIADASGIRGLHVGALPDSVVGLVQARCAYYELLADAALQKSKRIALQCLMVDTLTTSIPRARACIDEMFQVQAEFLPGYE